MDEVLWNQLQAAMERDCLKDRAWLSSWFVDTVSKQPDLLEQLWAGSRDSDAIGWRWCEYRVNDRKTYPGRFLVFYDGYLHLLPTAPLFVLRCRCETCWEMGFYVVGSHVLPVLHRHADPAVQCDDGAPVVTLHRLLNLLTVARSRATGADRRRTCMRQPGPGG